ncbi:MAG: hypothetical protein OEL84_06235 [Nitrosopumilus sp.]|nr:hypothetical protein [Nitrosopumilus sp.]MDH3340866.1 hypothetical protein [Nitrosopumilus sp.]
MYESVQTYLKHKLDVILLDLKTQKLQGSKVFQTVVLDNMDTQVVVTFVYVDDQDGVKHNGENCT